MPELMRAGITGFGCYIPRLRLSRQAIVDAHSWADPSLKGKAVGHRSMCNWDEDSVTMAVEAARNCLKDGTKDSLSPHPARPFDAIYFASTSAPFADRQHAGIVSTALSLGEDIASVDIGFSQKAGTSALLQAIGSVAGGLYDSALVVASDKRRSKAASPGELAYGDGAVAVGVGREKVLLEILAVESATVDFIDHFRAADQSFDYTWEERWIRDEGLAGIVPPVIQRALVKADLNPTQIDHFVMPSSIGRAITAIARKAGLKPESVRDNLHQRCGETGTAHPLMMLLNTLETQASVGDRILLTSFGQGCDVVVLGVTEAWQDYRDRQQNSLGNQLQNGREENNYQKYLAFNNLISLEKGMRAERDEYKTALSVTYRKRDLLLGLVGGRCRQCGTLQFPRTDICVNPQCHATDSQEPHSFRDEPAEILTWSADYLTYTAAPPSHYGMITFDEGGRFMTDFTDVEVGDIDVGTRVSMVFRIKSVDSLRGFVRYFWKAVPVRNKVGAQ